MSSLHTIYSERKNISNQMKEYETRLKKLRTDHKSKTIQLRKIMTEKEVEKYMDVKLEDLIPKEKKKPVTKKMKNTALIDHFKKLGVSNPEKFVLELNEIQKNARKQ